MKASTPALILYVSVCSLCALSYGIGLPWITPYAKAVVVPSICYYYFARNGYKIDFIKALIFLLCFLGDIIFLMQYAYYFMFSLLCFFVVYLLLIRYLLIDFRRNRFRKIDILPISLVVAFLVYLLVTILNLKFDEAERYYITFFSYGTTLVILGCICIANYIAKASKSSIYSVIMFICFLLSDIFYLIANYYYDLVVFQMIIAGTQLFSYYFMVNYFFLRNDEKIIKENS